MPSGKKEIEQFRVEAEGGILTIPYFLYFREGKRQRQRKKERLMGKMKKLRTDTLWRDTMAGGGEMYFFMKKQDDICWWLRIGATLAAGTGCKHL